MLIHPKGNRARVLLTSVFGPYAQDDEFGSRSINPMELYHNQVTKAQGAFSLRMFHRSWGILLIQANISAPSAVLDFPTRERFIEELKANSYDIVGITSIIVNVGKVREMCRLIREHAPQAKIVIGGHVTAIPGVEQMMDADHYVKGDGIEWMRRYVGDDTAAPVKHPTIVSGFGLRVLGVSIPDALTETAATIIPSVGCPMGCNFCTTSSFFGGKGKSLHFFHTGEDLFRVMCEAEKTIGARSFFMMDENFLLDRKRAMGLLEMMERHGKAWSMYVFSSANAIAKYTMEELVRLGVSWLWLGLESPQSSYSKLNGTETISLVRKLQMNGIRVLGSTIVGLEHHTPANMGAEIGHAVAHDTDFHQFMLYTPVPGTPLYWQTKKEGRLIEVDLADIHGQHQFNFQHAAITPEESGRWLNWAFQEDFAQNGPSLFRIARTTFALWKKHHAHSDARVRDRVRWECRSLRTMYPAALRAMEKRLEDSNPVIAGKMAHLRKALEKEFGPAARLMSLLAGPVLAWTSAREERKLAAGVTYEPPTFCERRNWAEPKPETLPALAEEAA